MQPLHKRMPVILKPQGYELWLARGDFTHPSIDLLRPYDADQMTAWKVGPDVDNVRNNRPELVEPVK